MSCVCMNVRVCACACVCDTHVVYRLPKDMLTTKSHQHSTNIKTSSLVPRPISSFSTLHAEKREGLVCKVMSYIHVTHRQKVLDTYR